MAEHYQTLIVGSGFGGISAAVNLLRQGLDDFVILERRTYVGGTWNQNRYPGAAVDVQSPLYSLSFARYDWSQLFAEQSELSAYTQQVYSTFDLHAKTRLDAEVSALQWLGNESRWQVTLKNGEQLTAQFVINASGPLSTPVIPDFKGRETFTGVQCHTNHWDPNIDYRHKRVAIIGSGASAVQVIPAIADSVQHLHVFQRTPHWVMPRKDYTFRPWQRRLLRTAWGYGLLRCAIYWALELRILGFKYSRSILRWLAERPARRHLQQQVQDDAMRARLTPDYTIGCKRILLSNLFYPALAKNNVTLHTQDDGIDHIGPDGITTTQGEHLALDMIIYATGFDATDGLIPYPVRGINNKLLADVWRDYPRAYLGTAIADFPNLFIVTGPNTGIGHTSALFMIEAQMHYIMAAMRHTRQRGKQSITVRAEAEQAYTDKIHQQMAPTVWQTGGCNSWYKSDSGKVIAMFPGFSFSFRRLCRRFQPDHHMLG